MIQDFSHLRSYQKSTVDREVKQNQPKANVISEVRVEACDWRDGSAHLSVNGCNLKGEKE